MDEVIVFESESKFFEWLKNVPETVDLDTEVFISRKRVFVGGCPEGDSRNAGSLIDILFSMYIN
jgi:hypothetical protein